jgi:hypothetical protein
VIGCSDDDPTTPQQVNPSGSIGVYEDIAGTDSDLTDTGGTVTFYVVHKVAKGAMGSSFRVEAPTGWTRIGAQNQFTVTLGTPEDGLSVGYGSCETGAIHVMTLTYTSPGNSAPGTTFKVLPHLGTPESIEVVDCNQNELRDGIGVESPVSLP